MELFEILKILLVFIVLAVIMEFIGLLLTRAIHIEDAAAFLWVGFPSVAVRFIFLTIGTTTSDGLVVVAILITLIADFVRYRGELVVCRYDACVQ